MVTYSRDQSIAIALWVLALQYRDAPRLALRNAVKKLGPLVERAPGFVIGPGGPTARDDRRGTDGM